MKHTRFVAVVVLAAVVSLVQATETSLYTFGRNTNSQLLQKERNVMAPTAVGEPLSKLCISNTGVSEYNSIFVTCDGKMYIAGANVDPQTGNYAIDGAVSSDHPVLVKGLEDNRVVMASLGAHHFLALTSKGKVFAWGLNGDGQLGFGGEENTLMKFAIAPLEIASLARQNIRFVTAAANRSAAISDDGRLFIWGDGKHGEMGDGSTRSHKKPTVVEALRKSGVKVCQVAMGSRHVVVVARSGDMYTWGDGTEGQLGLGDLGIQRKLPTQVSRLRKNVCQASAGNDFTGVITQDERLFLWGSNGYPSPFEKVFFQGTKPRQVAAGISHMVALLENGTVAAWGSRRNGQSGRLSGPEFTLDPANLDSVSGIRQMAVGSEQTILLAGPFATPSLCPCLQGFYSFWTSEVEYLPVCYEEEAQCGDHTCCAADETCCQVASDVKNLVTERSVDAIPGEPKGSAFRCVKAANATCCSQKDSNTNNFACPSSFKCDLENKRCLPASLSDKAPEEDKISNSEEPIGYTSTHLPGGNPAEGLCGVRKVTCPDETCCAKGQKCCRASDGSYGCCPHETGSCCSFGCCRDGFTCDNEKFACVKAEGSEVQVISQDKVESHCGSKTTCPDSSCCGEGTGCCVLQDGFFGCCPFSNGICCSDGAGCCPSRHKCDVAHSRCVADFTNPDGTPVYIAMKSTPRNTPSRSEATETQCPNGETCKWPGKCCDAGNGKFGCCDFANGTCCAGGLGCCPANYECDLTRSQCHAAQGSVPMKYNRDTSPKAHTPAPEKEVCLGETKCTDNTCCPLGSTCCSRPDGSMNCCAYKEGVCCEDGGCCAEGQLCDTELKGCRVGNQTSPYLGSQKSTTPQTSSVSSSISAPGKCYPDERLCQQGMCCPRSGTCCDKGFGQVGCCPQSHAQCCDGGGCCPGGATCDTEAKVCKEKNGNESPMLFADSSHAPETEYDIEECFADEQTCPGDGGCCYKTETCCLLETETGLASACCPHENGVCCKFGGCCPFEATCDEELQVCRNMLGEVIEDASSIKGSAVHPLDGLPELECADGSVCGPFDTCCSLGYSAEEDGEIFACCPFENGVCCTEFEGCCPNGYECDAESKSCLTEGREISAGEHAVPEPPPIYVCELPQTQCPNGKCCKTSQYCAKIGDESAENPQYRCVERGYATCGNASHACPVGLFCDMKNNVWMCSEEQDQDPHVKEDLIKKFWGEDVVASCNAAASLLEIGESDKPEEFTPEVKTEKAPQQFWYPKKLVIKSKAIKSFPTTLPTVLASKVCQHLSAINSSAVVDFCYVANSNGHFPIKDRDRVTQLVNEYIRRICIEQNCHAPKASTYEFVPEELNPCPCRVRPTPVPLPEEIVAAPEVAGVNETVIAQTIEDVSQQEQAVSNQVSTNSNSTNSAPQGFIPPVVDVPDEVPVVQMHIGPVAGAEPVTPFPDDQPTKVTLVPEHKDIMQLTESIDQNAHVGDADMLEAHRPETFMGKEACNEDGAEAAVDLDGEAASEMDAKADPKDEISMTLAQMNTKTTASSDMPEML